jgi:hypothetical protein
MRIAGRHFILIAGVAVGLNCAAATRGLNGVNVSGSVSGESGSSNSWDLNQGQGESYVPKNLDDCLHVLDQRVRTADVKKIRAGDITPAAMRLGMGQQIATEWGLSNGSRLALYFQKLGIDHAEDMSDIILESFVRHVKHEPIRLDEQVAYYKSYWTKPDGSQ